MDSLLKDLCLKLFEIGALKFGDFKMKVGVNSPVYFDLRIMISYPKIMVSKTMLHFVGVNIGFSLNLTRPKSYVNKSPSGTKPLVSYLLIIHLNT